MKKLAVLIVFAFFFQTALAQDAGTRFDVRLMMNSPWKSLPPDAQNEFSYQVNHDIRYSKGIPTNNRNFDVVLRAGTRGPDGSVSKTTLIVMTLICYPSGKMADTMSLLSIHAYPSDSHGIPNYPSDDAFYIDPNNAQAKHVNFGSAPALIGQELCRS